jgi:hypothetical protein
LRIGLLDFDLGWAKFWNNIFNQQAGAEQVNTWDYQFIFNQVHTGKLAVFPGRNLVRNVGFEEDATHTHHHDHFMMGLEAHEMKWPLRVDSARILPDKTFNDRYLKDRWSFYQRPNWKFYIGGILRKCIAIFRR